MRNTEKIQQICELKFSKLISVRVTCNTYTLENLIIYTINITNFDYIVYFVLHLVFVFKCGSSHNGQLKLQFNMFPFQNCVW